MRHVVGRSKERTLSEPVLFILTSLAEQPRHGYALLKDVELLSGNRVRLSTGTLYGALHRLLEEGWIERWEQDDVSRDKQAYRLTKKGRKRLQSELERLEVDSAIPVKVTTQSAGATPETMTAAEQTIAEIWKEVVGLKRIGRHDSFFDVGGHSLLATKVISRIARAFNVELPVRVVFEAPTIAELSELVARAQREQPKPVAPLIGRRSRNSEASDLLKQLERLSEAELRELLKNPKLKGIL